MKYYLILILLPLVINGHPHPHEELELYLYVKQSYEGSSHISQDRYYGTLTIPKEIYPPVISFSFTGRLDKKGEYRLFDGEFIADYYDIIHNEAFEQIEVKTIFYHNYLHNSTMIGTSTVEFPKPENSANYYLQGSVKSIEGLNSTLNFTGHVENPFIET
jgi:hypothetical protein